MSKSPSSKRYAEKMERREILDTRRARGESAKERNGSTFGVLVKAGGSAPMGKWRWTRLDKNLAKPILRTKKARVYKITRGRQWRAWEAYYNPPLGPNWEDSPDHETGRV